MENIKFVIHKPCNEIVLIAFTDATDVSEVNLDELVTLDGENLTHENNRCMYCGGLIWQSTTFIWMNENKKDKYNEYTIKQEFMQEIAKYPGVQNELAKVYSEYIDKQLINALYGNTIYSIKK